MTRWVCPDKQRCGKTHDAPPNQRGVAFHACRAAGGLNVQMVPELTKAKLVVVERQDWVGSEMVQLNDAGRPVMAVQTVRDDGIDCSVYAPCAVATMEDA